MAANANAGAQELENCDAACPNAYISEQAQAPRSAALFEFLKRVIVIQLDIAPEDEYKVTMDANFRNDLGASSLDMFEICITCEEAIDIEIPDEDMAMIVTVADLYDIIIKKLP